MSNLKTNSAYDVTPPTSLAASNHCKNRPFITLSFKRKEKKKRKKKCEKRERKGIMQPLNRFDT